MAEVQEFASREAASSAAATHIAGLCREELSRRHEAAIVVSGGTTPGRCFELLSVEQLDWARVHVLLSDERWVSPADKDSNERLVRDTLLTGEASDAKLLSVFSESSDVATHCDALQASYPHDPFACALLGMGADGHFASLFPGSDALAAGLALDNERLYIPVSTAASPHPRVSMTLAALLRSREVLLLFFGDEKRAVYDRASSGDASLPVSRLLEQQSTPVTLYWAP